MESTGNWIIDILNYSLNFWSDAIRTIWDLLTTSPQNFRGGDVWNVISSIQGGLKGIAYTLLVLFFLVESVIIAADGVLSVSCLFLNFQLTSQYNFSTIDLSTEMEELKC